jgi:hypothetical protein
MTSNQQYKDEDNSCLIVICTELYARETWKIRTCARKNGRILMLGLIADELSGDASPAEAATAREFARNW